MKLLRRTYLQLLRYFFNIDNVAARSRERVHESDFAIHIDLPLDADHTLMIFLSEEKISKYSWRRHHHCPFSSKQNLPFKHRVHLKFLSISVRADLLSLARSSFSLSLPISLRCCFQLPAYSSTFSTSSICTSSVALSSVVFGFFFSSSGSSGFPFQPSSLSQVAQTEQV